MNKLSFVFFLIISILISISCNDEVPTSNAINDTEFKSLQKGAPPSSGVVIRYEGQWWESWVDDNAGLVLIVGVETEDILPFACGGTADLDVFYIKDIISPSNEEGNRWIDQVKGEVHVSVWDITGYYEATTWCEYFSNTTLLASGMGNLRYNDNDFYAWAYDQKNHNSFGEKINGKLTTPGGERKILNFVFQAVWDGNDFDTYKEHIKIQLK